VGHAPPGSGLDGLRGEARRQQAVSRARVRQAEEAGGQQRCCRAYHALLQRAWGTTTTTTGECHGSSGTTGVQAALGRRARGPSRLILREEHVVLSSDAGMCYSTPGCPPGC
jgi:hypothetical protein